MARNFVFDVEWNNAQTVKLFRLTSPDTSYYKIQEEGDWGWEEIDNQQSENYPEIWIEK